jgi:UDP-hydrolysing UDP-N-acetyl-D-glucosamine 2-epimerase
MRAVRTDNALDLLVLAVGSHFLDSYGHTIDEIKEAGLHVDEVIAVNYDDSAEGISRAIGETVQHSTIALDKLQPDVVIFLGDRYEILAVALAATILRIPIAHIAGGDVTLGAYDEGFRHALTKLSHVHFTTNSDATARVRQLGEEPWRIHQVGSPGIDALLEARLLSKTELEERLSWKFRSRNLLVTLHPVTLEPTAGTRQAQALVAALESLTDDVGVVVTGTNPDSEGAKINAVLGEYCARNVPRALHVASLGNLRYLSMLARVDAVVGNSSSGLYEAPSLGTPTVDIGVRQKGRPRASSVIHCDVNVESIIQGIKEALLLGRTSVANPYGDGHAVEKIVSVLRTLPDRDTLLLKAFVDSGKVDQ